MVYLLTGQKGSGKTQKMIELANQKAKACDGNVVFIKNSHNDTCDRPLHLGIQLVQHRLNLIGCTFFKRLESHKEEWKICHNSTTILGLIERFLYVQPRL